MIDTLLNDLSIKLEALLRCQKSYQKESQFLHEVIGKLKVEQSKLKEKNQVAAEKTQAIIKKLENQNYE